MTHPSTSGTPYLILRSDTGKYVYWRILSERLALRADGKVDLSWTSKPYVLRGNRVIKISLNTGDSKLAHRRWGEVHSRIEALMEVSTSSAMTQVEPVASTNSSLTSADRAIIAAQARHDVMADHDADWTHPSTLSPLARGLEQALRRRDAGSLAADGAEGAGPSLAGFLKFLERFPAGMTLNQIRDAARAMEADNVGRMLASGRTWPLDSPISEVEELEAGPENPSTLHVVNKYDVPGELTERLVENGYDLSDEMERRKVAHAVLMAKAAAHQDILLRAKGIAIETPPRPAPLKADDQGEEFPTILQMHDIWSDRIKPDRKTKDDRQGLLGGIAAGDVASLDRTSTKRARAKSTRNSEAAAPRAAVDLRLPCLVARHGPRLCPQRCR